MLQVHVGGLPPDCVRRRCSLPLIVVASLVLMMPMSSGQTDARQLAAQEEIQRQRREFASCVDRIRRQDHAVVYRYGPPPAAFSFVTDARSGDEQPS